MCSRALKYRKIDGKKTLKNTKKWRENLENHEIHEIGKKELAGTLLNQLFLTDHSSCRGFKWSLM